MAELLGDQMSKRPIFTPGQQIVVEMYPFSRVTFVGYDSDGPFSDAGWRPGCDRDQSSADGIDDHTADGLGAMLIQIVDVVQLPGGFAPRVFYVRRWRDPDGKEFGKKLCRVTTVGTLAKTVKGYRHPFFVDGEYVDLRCGIYPVKKDD